MDGSAKCDIRPDGAGIHVAVYHMDSGKEELDAIEGIGYTSEMLDIPGFGECFAYIASHSHVDIALSPYDWYKEMVLLGCESQRFPDAYTSSVRLIDSIPDPNVERRQFNWKTIEMLKNGNRVSKTGSLF